MANEKSETIKIYMVVGLTVMLLISGYFRFIHAKLKGGEKTAPAPSASAAIQIPSIEVKTSQKTAQVEPARFDFLPPTIRDIFAEPEIPTPPKKEVEEKPTKIKKILKDFKDGYNVVISEKEFEYLKFLLEKQEQKDKNDGWIQV